MIQKHQKKKGGIGISWSLKFIPKRAFLIILIGVSALFIRCQPNLDDVSMLKYSTVELDKVYDRVEKGEGDDEFSQKRDQSAAKKQVEEIEKRIYYTFRTGMRQEDWENKSISLPSWAYADDKKIPLWKDPYRPQREIELPTHTPWIINPYSFDEKTFHISASNFDYLIRRMRDLGKYWKSGIPVARCFGDITPSASIIEIKDGSVSLEDFLPPFWMNTDKLDINLNEKEAESLTDKLKELQEVKLKVYYKIRDRWCYVVKVEGLDDHDNLMFETDLDTDIKTE